MNPTSVTSLQFAELLAALRAHRLRWIAPGVALAIAALALPSVVPPKWVATQAMMIRNEAGTAVEGRGKFRQVEELKITQGTVLEIAKSRPALEAALRRVGPPSGKSRADYPTPKDVARLRKAVAVVAPSGTEFGKTEVFYLKVKDADRERAVALASALSAETQSAFQAVLNAKSGSMAQELERSLAVANRDLGASSAKLQSLEQKVGSDLGELRILQQQPSSNGELRQRVVFIENEIQALRNRQRLNNEMESLLKRLQQDPRHVMAAPNSLLESQVALKRLKEGLVAAQLKKAELLGNMSEDHPTVKAAAMAEGQIRNEIQLELTAAIHGIDDERRMIAGQLETFQQQLAETQARLEKIAGLRTEYANLSAEVDHRTKLVEGIETDLTEARAGAAGANAASLITLIDKPDPGVKPEGPGRAMLGLAGLMGGLFGGVGLVILTVPKTPIAAPSSESRLGTPLAERSPTESKHAQLVDDQVTLHFN